MAHKVTMKQPKDHLVNADVEFTIRGTEKKIGTLKVSKGNLVWVPSGNSVKTYKIPWRKLGAVLEQDAFLVRKPRS